VKPHSRLVYSSFFEPKGVPPKEDEAPVIVTVTLDEREGRTHLVARELYPSKEVLDVAIASGMEHGVRVTMDQLDELVASLG
jgi:uncharacterized protein YndB with AHSA1/START domain